MAQSGGKWGIEMFMGEYHHTIDDKGRLIIPAKFRSELGTRFVLTRGLENCLYVYQEKEWNDITAKIKTLPFTKKDVRMFTRFFFSGATECSFDSQGRISITSPLISYADILKDCVVIGVSDRIEIWSKEEWEKFLEDNNDKLEDTAEKLFEGIDFGETL